MGIADFAQPNIEKLKEKRDVKGLIKALNYKEDYYVRIEAAKTLGEIGDKRAVAPLIQALKDEAGYVRIEAAKALGEIGWQPENNAEKVSYLMAKGQWDELVKLGKSVVALLIQALKDKNWYIRWRTAEVLGEIGGKQPIKALVQALKNEKNETVKESIKEALEKAESKNNL